VRDEALKYLEEIHNEEAYAAISSYINQLEVELLKAKGQQPLFTHI